MDKYTVTRQHYGDKQYYEGDERELSAADAKVLIEAGLVAEAEPEDKKTKSKAESNIKNKMQDEPKNKSE